MSITATRWAAVGHSSERDARAAGRAAADQALEHDDAKLIVVFCTDSYDLPELLAGINERTGHVPLIGCSTAGQFATGVPADAGVVVTAIGGDGFSAVTAAGQPVDGDLRAVGAQVASQVASLKGKQHRVVMLLSDALA